MILGVFLWVVVGLAVGFVCSKLVNLRGDDPLIGIVAGVAGAVVAGVLHAVISGRGVPGFDAWQLAFAAIGAAVAAAGWHAYRSRSISHTRPSIRRSY